MNYQEPRGGQTSSLAGSPPVRNTRRVTIITTAIVVVVLALFWGFNLWRGHAIQTYMAANAPPPPPVNTEIAQPGTLPQSLSAIGSVAAVHQVMVSPEIAGRVTKFSFLPGTEVKKGDVLVEINDAPEQADLASAKAQERMTRLALERTQRLADQGFQAKAQLEQTQSQHDAAAAAMARDEAVIAQKHIRAPFDGVLGVRQVEVGQYVNTGAALVMLTDLSSLYVDFTLPEQARPQLALGQDVQVAVDAYPGRAFVGKIYVLDPQVSPDTRTIKLQALVENRDRLLMPGMFAHVEVMLPPQQNVITVAETALDHNVYGDFVYVVRDGGAGKDGKPQLKVVRTPVTAGAHSLDRVAVAGLQAGDRVVTAGQVKLFDGAPVTLASEPVLVKPKELPFN